MASIAAPARLPASAPALDDWTPGTPFPGLKLLQQTDRGFTKINPAGSGGTEEEAETCKTLPQKQEKPGYRGTPRGRLAV